MGKYIAKDIDSNYCNTYINVPSRIPEKKKKLLSQFQTRHHYKMPNDPCRYVHI